MLCSALGLKASPLNIASSGLGLAITEMKSVLSNLFLDRCLIEYSGWRNRILINRNKGVRGELFNQRLSRHSKRGMQKIGATLESQEVQGSLFLYPLPSLCDEFCKVAGPLPVTSNTPSPAFKYTPHSVCAQLYLTIDGIND